MRAAMHLAILMMTVYDYFYPKKSLTYEDFIEQDEESKGCSGTANSDYLLMGTEKASKKKFRSMADADLDGQHSSSLYPFDTDDEDEEEEERKNEDEGYRRMDNDPIEGVNTATEQPGIGTRFWNGASAIFNKYHKRKRALERHTA